MLEGTTSTHGGIFLVYMPSRFQKTSQILVENPYTPPSLVHRSKMCSAHLVIVVVILNLLQEMATHDCVHFYK